MDENMNFQEYQDKDRLCRACMARNCKFWDYQLCEPRQGVNMLRGHQRAFERLGFAFNERREFVGSALPNY
jgi:hypothetical protein